MPTVRSADWLPLVACLLLTLLGSGPGASQAQAASLDQSIIANPTSVLDLLDRASAARWHALFEEKPRWIARQIAYLENHQPDLLLSLLVSRLLYTGEPWLRRSTDIPNKPRWRQTDLEVRSTILRTLRSHRDAILVPALCQYLTFEVDPALISSALTDLYLIEPKSVATSAVRLADPRDFQDLRGATYGTSSHPRSEPPADYVPLPGSNSTRVRERCLAFLVDIAGINAVETRQALDWALLHTNRTWAECIHAISLIPVGEADDLLRETVLHLTDLFRQATLDPGGQLCLVMAITRLTGSANADLVTALMELAANADRAVATTAATCLATSLQWKGRFDVSQIAHRAKVDPDPAVRQSLLAFLVRLYPSAVKSACPPDSPWAALATHEEKLAAIAAAAQK